MGKQKIILTQILIRFEKLQFISFKKNERIEKEINELFNSSLNKKEIVRKILNECVLSDDEIIILLRICFKKESEL